MNSGKLRRIAIRRWTNTVPAVLIVLLGWFVFSPVFRGGWLWDDQVDITDNQNLRNAAGLIRIWIAPAASVNYFPFKSTVQWIQWHFWENQTLGYHLTNVFLHVMSAILFAILLRRLGTPAAWLGGLIFVVHPVTVESVAWVSELKNTLSLPLLLAALLAYLKFDEAVEFGGGCTAYVAALSFFLLAMLSKTTVAMFPLVILLYAWWKRGRLGRRDLKSVAPFFAVSMLLGLVTVYCEHHWPLRLAAPDPPMRLGVAGVMLAFYLRTSVVPLGLLPIYPRWSFRDPWLIFASAWLLFVPIGTWLWRKRCSWGRHALFALGWWAVNLLPVLGLVAMSYHQFSWVADHFAYVSLLGVVGAGTAIFGAAWKRYTFGWIRPALAFLGSLIVIFFAIDSRSYASVFRSSESLWTYTLKHNPDAWIAENGLGFDLLRSGQLPQAIEHLERAVFLQPRFEMAQYNLADAMMQTGRVPDAIKCYERAIAINPAFVTAHNDLGIALCRIGRAADAVPHFRTVLRLQPDLPGAHSNLGTAYSMLGKFPEAIAEFEEALRLDPSQTGARRNLNLAKEIMDRDKRAW